MPNRKEITMKKICILNRSCMSSNYYRILNSCEGKYQVVRHLRDADWCIFPYCSCTDENIVIMEKELKQCLRHKKKECKVIVTGCIFFVKEEKRKFLEKYNIDYLIPMDHQVEEICELLGVTPSNSVYNHYKIYGEVKIAEGCLNKCAFCRIHYSNRKLCSTTIEEIENQVKDLVSRGIKFVRLVGLNTAQYGLDLYGKKALPLLLQRLSKIEGIEGIEVYDCSLSDIDNDIANEIIYNETVLAVYIDIQSGSDPVLKAMNVGHDVGKIKKYIPLMKSKIRYTRIISGFPGETMDDVLETITLLDSLGIYNFFVSEYCNSKDTPAGKMQQLSPMEIQAHTLMYNQMKQMMLAKKMLQEDGNKYIGYISGFSLKFLKVYCPAIGEIKVAIEEQHWKLNLMDKVEIFLKSGKYSLGRIIEASPIKTEFPNKSTNQLVDLLSNLEEMTTDFTIPIAHLFSMTNAIFCEYGGPILSQEEFQKNISDLPKVLQDSLMVVYSHQK